MQPFKTALATEDLMKPLETLRYKMTALAMCSSLLALSACQEYDAPPEVSIVAAEGGGYVPGTMLALKFSERIDADSLLIKIWPNSLNQEQEFEPEIKPLVDGCTVSSCGSDVSIELGQDERTLWMDFNQETLGKAGSAFLIEVQPGLKDKSGNDTGAVQRFSVSFKLDDNGRTNTEPVPFDQGTYVLVGEITKPLPATLNLVADVKVLEDGRFTLVGAEGEHIEGAPKNTANPDELTINTTKTGFAVFIPSGFVFYRDGERLLETDPVDVAVPLGFLDVTLKDVRLTGKIVKNPETNKDRIESTLTFSQVTIKQGARITEYEAGATAFEGDWVEPARAPEGHPKICSDFCGILTRSCEPPSPWPPEDFCDSK